MKKFIFLLAVLFTMVTAAQAQNYSSWRAPKDGSLRASLLAYGGYNFLEEAPAGGVAVGLNLYCLRAEVDLGFSSIDTPSLDQKHHNLMFFSPSVGVSFGNKFEFYAMVGCINWGSISTRAVTECGKDKFSSDLFHWRLRAGSNIMVSRKIFVNVDLSYMIPKDAKDGYVYFDNLMLRAGVGYRF